MSYKVNQYYGQAQAWLTDTNKALKIRSKLLIFNAL